MRFVARPLIVEAEQWDGKSWDRYIDDPYARSLVRAGSKCLFVFDKNANMWPVEPGDYVIRELDGKGYSVCKASTFEATYEPTS